MTIVSIKIKRLPNGLDLPVPSYKTSGAAGMDVVSAENCDIKSGEWAAISTGFAFEIPLGYEVQVRPRSSLARHKGVTCLNTPGTIDSDYRGEVQILLINHGPESFEIARGDRIAQLVISPVQIASFEEVEILDDTARGTGGFGSTGTR